MWFVSYITKGLAVKEKMILTHTQKTRVLNTSRLLSRSLSVRNYQVLCLLCHNLFKPFEPQINMNSRHLINQMKSIRESQEQKIELNVHKRVSVNAHVNMYVALNELLNVNEC